MGRSLRQFSSLALAALAGLFSVGCGGNSGTQPSTSTPTLSVSAVTAYPASLTATATPVETLSDGSKVQPLAIFTSKSSEELVVWGVRNDAGNVVGVHESAVTSSDTSSKLNASPIYARYAADGSLVSLKDTTTSSSITFSALDTTSTTSKGSITAVGIDNKGKTASATATLQNDGGVTVNVNKAEGKTTQHVSRAEIKAILAKARDAAPDPLIGLTTVDTEPTARTQILTAIFKAASLVVDDAFKTTITDTEGFLLLNELGEGYTAYLAKGNSPTLAADATTPLAYRTDLPTP